MHIKQLQLVNFKNLKEVDVQFSSNLNCFIGNNGAGKTNLMDAIYYLSFCKSFQISVEELNISHGEDFVSIQGKYQRLESGEKIYCGFKRNQKKHFKRNNKQYRKLSDHIGLLPLVIITPSDIELIMGGSAERRRFIDALISQYDKVYLDQLMRYNRALQQRNKLLKDFSASDYFSEEMLAMWSDQIVLYGKHIFDKRVKYITSLQPVFQNYYKLISSGNETIELIYQSQMNDGDFLEMLNEALPRDRALQFTSVGIHKDDILFNIDNYPIKILGSQGQKKTYLVALKFAQFNFIKKVSGITPILLMDDIFDKLDKNRVKQIIKLVGDDHFGQIFITDTNREHLDKVISSENSKYKIFTLDNGTVSDSL